MKKALEQMLNRNSARLKTKKSYLSLLKDYTFLILDSHFEANVMPRDVVYLVKHGLKIPRGASAYVDFFEKMIIREQEFKNVFSN